MRQLNKQLNLQNKSGFTLVEVVISLFVTCLVIILLSDSLSLVKRINQKSNRGNQIAFCYTQLAQFLEDNDGFKIDVGNSTNQKLVIIKLNTETKTTKANKLNDSEVKSKKIYTIEQYKNLLRVRGMESGHMPLLINIKKASFEFDEKKFKIKIREKDNRQSELVFATNVFSDKVKTK